MYIIQEIEEVIGWVIKQVLLLAGVLLAVAIAPVILAVLPQVLIARNPQGNFSGLAQLFFWVTPLSVAFWMAVLCHFHSIRLWLREGKDSSEWRDAHGGFWHTNLKSTGFMVLGFFGSVACEILFVYMFRRLPYGLFDGAARFRLWFALFPFAAFAPVILLFLWRWLRNRKIRSLTAQSFLAIPEQIAKAVGVRVGGMDHKQIIRIAKRGPAEAALVGQALEDHFREMAAGYRQAAQMMREEEERREADAKMKRERELELLRRIDAQIALMGDETANN